MTTVAGQFLHNFQIRRKPQGLTRKIFPWREYIPLRYVSDDPTPDPHQRPKIFWGVKFWKFD